MVRPGTGGQDPASIRNINSIHCINNNNSNIHNSNSCSNTFHLNNNSIPRILQFILNKSGTELKPQLDILKK